MSIDTYRNVHERKLVEVKRHNYWLSSGRGCDRKLMKDIDVSTKVKIDPNLAIKKCKGTKRKQNQIKEQKSWL